MGLALLVMLPVFLHAQTQIDLATQSRGELPAGTRENIRYSHLFASGGSGAGLDPWTFDSGNPWAEAIADGGEIIYLVPGTYRVSSCPSIVPGAISVIGFNRESTIIVPTCRKLKDRVDIIDATNASPIEIETGAAHGFATGDSVNITGVPGNSSANGDWQVTVVDATHFSLDGSAGSGNYVNTKTGMWAGQIFPISATGDGYPIQVDLPGNHNLANGDRVYIRGMTGVPSPEVNGFHFVTVFDADSLLLGGAARAQGTLSGGVLERVIPTSIVATETNARGIEIRGLKFNGDGSGSWLSTFISFKANESVVEEIEGRYNPLDMAPTASTFQGSKSAEITFDADGAGADTVDLTLTGGGSRAAGPYTTYTVAFDPAVNVSNINSPVGGSVFVALSAAANFEDGDQITISTTAETTAAGAAGTFPAVRLTASYYALVGSSGTGSSCSSGCGGATVSQVSLERNNLANEFADHLNADTAFGRDYFATPEGPVVFLLERHLEASPVTFTVSSPISHTTTAWAANGRGGVFILKVENESFSSRFGRIFCSGGLPVANCIRVQGINNQQSFRDIRLSGSLNAGWGFRFASGSNIQNIDIFNVTTEASYGAIEVGSMVSGSIRTVYMEAQNEFGIRVLDPVGAAHQGGFGFTHGVSIHGGLLLGTPGLELKKGKGITAENVVVPNGCVIGPRCEDCRVVASWTNGCDVQSPSGHVEDVTFLGKTNPGVNRYAARLATPVGGFLTESLTNLAKQSNDLTAAPWFGNTSTALVTATNPLGVSELISRASATAPTQFQTVNAGFQSFAGLTPNERYTVSYWARLLTPAATCRLTGEGSSINVQVQLKAEDDWLRIAGPVTADGSGNLTIAVRCLVNEAGLPDFDFAIWGFMLHRAVTDGALMPHVPTTSSAVTIGPGLYVALGAGASIAPGGSTPSCQTYTVLENALTALSTTEDIVLFNLSARAKISGVNVKHSQAFTGGALTAMTVSVGDSSSPTFYSSAFDIFQPTGSVAMQDTDGFKSSTSAARDVLARFTATGANVADATSGSLDVAVCWAVMP